MKKIRKFLLGFIISLLLFTVMFSFSIERSVKANEKEYVLEGEAKYRVEEVLEDSELFYGLHYEHDLVYTSILNQARIIGLACGGSSYGNIPLNLGEEYSQSAHILTIPASSSVKIVPWSIIKNGDWQLSTIIACANDYEKTHPGYKVIAGINGDFFDINSTMPYPKSINGAMAAEGEIIKSVYYEDWPAIAFKNDGSNTPLIKTDSPRSNSYPTLYIYEDEEIVYQIDIDGVNIDANSNLKGTYLYFSEFVNGESGNHVLKPIDVKNAYIVSNPSKTVAFAINSYYGIGEIDKIGDDTLKRNQFAISTDNKELLTYLEKGRKIKVQFEFSGELSGAENVTGIGPTFLSDGRYVNDVPLSDYMDYRYPRTLIGYKKDGSVVMAVTDGRQSSKGYYGLNGVESAAQMLYEGCVSAYSFDGGGSTTMVILQNGELKCVNSPSDGSLRNDGNAILIVAEVPEVDINFECSQSEISFSFDIIKMMDEYKDLYIELNGEKKKIEEGKKITFTNLSYFSDYSYQVYAYLNDTYVYLPFAGTIKTSKRDYTLTLYEISIRTNDKGLKEYLVKYSLDDPDNALVTIVFNADGKRIYGEDGEIVIPYSYASPFSIRSRLVITYELDKIEGRKSDEYTSESLSLNDAITSLDEFKREIEDMMDDFVL